MELLPAYFIPVSNEESIPSGGQTISCWFDVNVYKTKNSERHAAFTVFEFAATTSLYHTACVHFCVTEAIRAHETIYPNDIYNYIYIVLRKHHGEKHYELDG